MNNGKTTETRSNTPLLIIGAVLVVALLGGWWFYSSSKGTPPSANNSSSNSNQASKPKTLTIPANAPPGAQPPNQQGSPTAAVTLEEFADFQCPQCAAENPTMNEIKTMYGSRIRFIFRNFPLEIPRHDKAYDAAVAAEAAGLQNKFWEMQAMLFNNQKIWTEDDNYKQVWKGYAQKLGLDVSKWETDIAGLSAKTRVDEDKKRGKAIGISGTPTLFINGTAVSPNDMKIETLKSLIDAELAKASPQSQSQPQAQPPGTSKQPQGNVNALAVD